MLKNLMRICVSVKKHNTIVCYCLSAYLLSHTLEVLAKHPACSQYFSDNIDLE